MPDFKKRRNAIDYINIQGDENTVIQELSNYMHQGGAKLLVQNFSSFVDILSDDEIFDMKREKQDSKNGLGFIMIKWN